VQILQSIKGSHIRADPLSHIGLHYTLEVILVTVSAAKVAVQSRADGKTERIRRLKFSKLMLSLQVSEFIKVAWD
jgi:hypothetical protein